MDTLRQEVLQAQQTRSDLLKWKVFLIGVIGSVGLGLAGARPTSHADLVLCAVPLTCAYVDLLSRSLNLRMLVIGAFLRQDDDPAGGTIKRYERFVHEMRAHSEQSGDGLLRSLRPSQSPFALESWAVVWSTGVISLSVLVYGFAVVKEHQGIAAGIAFMLSGVLGGALTLFGSLAYDRRSKRLA